MIPLEIRSLFLNLKDKGNPGLRNEIVLGLLAADKVVNMSKDVSSFASAYRNGSCNWYLWELADPAVAHLRKWLPKAFER